MYDAVLLTIDEQFCNSCDADSNVVAEHYCLNCGDHLCEACRLAHRRVKVLAVYTKFIAQYYCLKNVFLIILIK